MTNPLPPDQAPWLEIAKAINNHEWDRAHTETLKSVHIGLRSIQHPDCQAANEIVMGLMEQRKAKKK